MPRRTPLTRDRAGADSDRRRPRARGPERAAGWSDHGHRMPYHRVEQVSLGVGYGSVRLGAAGRVGGPCQEVGGAGCVGLEVDGPAGPGVGAWLVVQPGPPPARAAVGADVDPR